MCSGSGLMSGLSTTIWFRQVRFGQVRSDTAQDARIITRGECESVAHRDVTVMRSGWPW